MVGMARRAVPARVVAGGTNIRATLAIEGVAPLHAARTSQRDVPTTLNRYTPQGVRVVLFENQHRRSARQPKPKVIRIPRLSAQLAFDHRRDGHGCAEFEGRGPRLNAVIES